MDQKDIVIAIIVILAIVLAYVILLSPLTNSYIPDGLPSDQSQFLLSIADSKLVYIVMDIRGASAAAKQNILQCGVDFAGSEGLAGKEIIAFALDNNQCVAIDNASKPIKECLDLLQNAPVLYIESGEQTIFYQKDAMVGIGETYNLYDCRINVM